MPPNLNRSEDASRRERARSRLVAAEGAKMSSNSHTNSLSWSRSRDMMIGKRTGDKLIRERTRERTNERTNERRTHREMPYETRFVLLDTLKLTGN